MPQAVERPGYDLAAVRTGIVHFGPGAFFRAHVADYLEAVLGADPSWGACAVALNSTGVRDALDPQDGLYTLVELDAEPRAKIIGAVREWLVAQENAQTVLARLAAPETRLVTLTVTEKGYHLDAAGDFDLRRPDVRHDVEAPAGAPPRTAAGWLLAGLRARRESGEPPFVTLSCDNVSDNGGKLGRAVAALARGRGDSDLAAWIEAQARFPCTMVDSIAPATDADARAMARRLTGLEDAWPVQRERFKQWVIEDTFGTEHPDVAQMLGAAGATLTGQVAPFENAKLRLLNAAHSSLAYLGLLAGLDTVGQAMAQPRLAHFVEALLREDAAPVLTDAAQLDPQRYVSDVLARFRNPAIRHALVQIAGDGSQKLPLRLLPTVRAALSAGRPPRRPALVMAAWMRWIQVRARGREPLADPLADRLVGLGRQASGDPGADVALFLQLDGMWGDLASDATWRAELERAYSHLAHAGALAALA